jgi:streptomycin 6-kinase
VISIPNVLRRSALWAGAEQWLDDLPALVSELEQRWNIRVGAPLTGGHVAYVTEATTTDGDPVVLKVRLPLPLEPDAARREIAALRLADGEGCAALLRDDPDLNAMLLERLGASLLDLGLPMVRRHEILCDTAARMWRPATDVGLPTGADRARDLATWIAKTWEDLDRPCTERAVEQALACARHRESAHDNERAVLVHGDVHGLNALQADVRFKLIDPIGLVAEAEYDLGTLMRGDPEALLAFDPREQARWLAARTGRDAKAIWEWGVIHRMQSGLHCEEIDFQPLGRQTLAAVEAWSSSRHPRS